MIKEPEFTIGIEEEYLLVDKQSRDLIREVPAGMFAECEALLPDQVAPEFLQCQIEVGTRVCGSVKEAAENLAELRRVVSGVADKYGLAIMAAATHPFNAGLKQERTNKERYNEIAEDLQGVARRLVICGMHVHVGIGNDDLRIDLLNQMSYALPHLLALSTSSPFWKGQDSGLMSYRVSVWDELPRTGLPDSFDSYSEYRRHVDVLVNAGLIEDGTKLWWDVRPSERFPTLEMRIADVCTRIEDGVCIAALYLCWLRMLYRLRVNNQRWRRYASMLINENRWRAHRYGFNEGLVDFGKGELVPYSELLEEMLEVIQEDAEYFGCVEEVAHSRLILQRGSSAHHQLTTYQRAIEQGADQAEALRQVVDMLVEQTRVGC